MSDILRRYQYAQGGKGSLLSALEEHAAPSRREILEVAGRVKIPEAAARGAASFYADIDAKQGELLICRGTSCQLAGAERLQTDLSRRHDCRGGYCLGYCHCSPVVLSGEKDILWGRQAAELDAGAAVMPCADSSLSIRSLGKAIVTHRLMRGDFAQLSKAQQDGAYETLRVAIRGTPEQVLDAVDRARVRGRGGAGFPAGAKWRRCAETAAEMRYVVVNGDEGDPGSFIDRLLMERDPHCVLEGLLLCGFAVGARKGIVFIRSEYPEAVARMQAAIDEARADGVLGASVLGSSFAFDAAVVTGLGSYVCGEETALLNAIEGFRGEVRLRPPYPAEAGLHGRPTVVNNVETLAAIPAVVKMGSASYGLLGTKESSGTKVMCLNNGFARPGVLEVEFGVTLREVIEEAGGGAPGKLDAVILGGPMGSILPPGEWDVRICYGEMAERGIQLGHGGLVAVPKGTDYRNLLTHWLEFMVHESCGRCVPCRNGSEQGLRMVRSGTDPASFAGILSVMEQGSLCAFGQNMPGPMRRIVELFGEHVLSSGGTS